MSDQCQVIVFASQKGGSGKTTLAGHVAVQADLAGAGPVALIDTDPQGSLAKWWNSRETETPSFAQATLPTLERDIETLKRGGAKLIVIDTPPAVTSSIVEVVTHADLVVIPTRPSPHDLRAVGATVDIAEHQNKQLVFVVNSATMRARITTDTAVALSQHGTVAPSVIHHRVDFAASMIDGRTVSEINPESRSAKEIQALWEYLDERLSRMREIPDPLRSAAPPVIAPQMSAPPPPASPLPPAEPVAAEPVVETPVVSAPRPQLVATPVVEPAPATPRMERSIPVAEPTEPPVVAQKRFDIDEDSYEIDDLPMDFADDPPPAEPAPMSAAQEDSFDALWREPVAPTGHVDYRLGLARFGRRVRAEDDEPRRQEG